MTKEATDNKYEFHGLISGIMDNLPQVIFIIALIGGVVELFFLINIMGYKGIQYFSTTQALTYGISFVSIISLFILIMFMFSFTFKKLTTENFLKKWYKFHAATRVIVMITLFLYLYLIYYIFQIHSSNIYHNMGYAMISIFIIVPLIKIINKFKKKPIKIENEFTVIPLVAAILFTFGSVLDTRNTIINEERICKDDCKLVYFNDTYLFLQKTKDEENVIEVKSFNDFFK